MTKEYFLSGEQSQILLTIDFQDDKATVTLGDAPLKETKIVPLVTEWTIVDGTYYSLGRMIYERLKGARK